MRGLIHTTPSGDLLIIIPREEIRAAIGDIPEGHEGHALLGSGLPFSKIMPLLRFPVDMDPIEHHLSDIDGCPGFMCRILRIPPTLPECCPQMPSTLPVLLKKKPVLPSIDPLKALFGPPFIDSVPVNVSNIRCRNYTYRKIGKDWYFTAHMKNNHESLHITIGGKKGAPAYVGRAPGNERGFVVVVGCDNPETALSLLGTEFLNTQLKKCDRGKIMEAISNTDLGPIVEKLQGRSGNQEE